MIQDVRFDPKASFLAFTREHSPLGNPSTFLFLERADQAGSGPAQFRISAAEFLHPCQVFILVKCLTL